MHCGCHKPGGAVKGAESVTLVGMPGSGKSRLGRALATRLRTAFVDTDKLATARIGYSIPELFGSEQGEELFRSVERRVALDAATSPSRLVIALGGGAFVDDEARAALLRNTFCCWLDCSPQLLWRRLRGDARRPLLKAAGDEEKRRKIEKLAAIRLRFYEKAHYRLRLEEQAPVASSVAEICQRLEQT